LLVGLCLVASANLSAFRDGENAVYFLRWLSTHEDAPDPVQADVFEISRVITNAEPKRHRSN
jgi:hypothetical protein